MTIAESNITLSKSLFWDVDFNTVDLEKHAAFIIERVTSRGEWEEFRCYKQRQLNQTHWDY